MKIFKRKVKLQRNKYLDKLRIPIRDYGTNFIEDKDERASRWLKQQKDYGFDERETWNLDTIFVEWLYSHFMMYKEITLVDLSYFKFTYNKKKITQGEAIDIICEMCKDYLTAKFLEKDQHKEIFSKKTMKLLGELMPYMWW